MPPQFTTWDKVVVKNALICALRIQLNKKELPKENLSIIR